MNYIYKERKLHISLQYCNQATNFKKWFVVLRKISNCFKKKNPSKLWYKFNIITPFKIIQGSY